MSLHLTKLTVSFLGLIVGVFSINAVSAREAARANSAEPLRLVARRTR